MQRASSRHNRNRYLTDCVCLSHEDGALVVVGLLALLGVTVGWAIWGWQQTAGTAMETHGGARGLLPSPYCPTDCDAE